MNIYYASLSVRALIHTITSFIHISSTQKVFLGHLWLRSFDIITENDSFIIDKSPIAVDSIFFSLKQAYFSIIMHFRFLHFYSKCIILSLSFFSQCFVCNNTIVIWLSVLFSVFMSRIRSMVIWLL